MRRNVNALLVVVELSKIKKCLKRCCDFKKKKKLVERDHEMYSTTTASQWIIYKNVS
jgi:hypothetical protein